MTQETNKIRIELHSNVGYGDPDDHIAIKEWDIEDFVMNEKWNELEKIMTKINNFLNKEIGLKEIN